MCNIIRNKKCSSRKKVLNQKRLDILSTPLFGIVHIHLVWNFTLNLREIINTTFFIIASSMNNKHLTPFTMSSFISCVYFEEHFISATIFKLLLQML